MDEFAKNYIENPTLVIGLSIVVISLGGFLYWLVRWILNKMLTTLNNNTEAMTMFAATAKHLNESIDKNTNVMSSIVTEQKLINQRLSKN